MKNVNLKGNVLIAGVGYGATIETEGKIIETSKVKSVTILHDKTVIETQNTLYHIEK